MTMKTAERMAASSTTPKSSVPTGIWRLFQDKRTASLCASRRGSGFLSAMVAFILPDRSARFNMIMLAIGLLSIEEP